ncbi:gamma-mobile-trio recombinase GmtY [Pseudomonas multiresinivorans]|uniref:Site-specific integrase n=1 Tax=Pseudomonas multiresinivorans TaxID=95301 RepID=A0A7Z3BNN4_9PSED|nr:gamma-mobile-trio recombinase GmtY [Pseudomonas multiresinivorans]QJP10019.1 site-specific integrase [Pseudomonas multiresinivorans]
MAYVLKVKARYREDNTGRELRLPALLTENGLLMSHLRYLAEKASKGQSWRERSAFAVMLLLKYINANEGVFGTTTELLRSFDAALRAGTINPATLEDPSGLYWRSRTAEDADNLVYLITEYTDWRSQKVEYNAQPVNPFRLATNAEQRLNWCAYLHKHERVFLNHLPGAKEARKRTRYARTIARVGAAPLDVEEVKRFPEDNILKLLDEGFIRANNKWDPDRDKRTDWKGRALTLLMHYGGIRKSEAFQLYLTDIDIDPERLEAIVRIYHPSEGASPEEGYSSRKEYLAQRFHRVPRTEYLKSERLHAGWKAPVLSSSEKFFKVEFFPPAKATEFLHAYQKYLIHQRVEPEYLDHPYAFTNSLGQPETIKNFQRIHKDAVNRIGLEHAKNLGTTEHGHRHAYGYRLSAHGFSGVEIQKMMRHRTLEAHLAYTQPTHKDVREKMDKKVKEYGL